jgi:hypothetical protein
MECSARYGCGRWFWRIEDFDHHMVGYDRRCLSDEELEAAGVAFLRPERRVWDETTAKSVPIP